LAHVVLPATTFAEKEGTFTNTERRVQRVRKGIPAIGESRPDWLITCQLAEKMGKKGFAFDNPSKIMQEIASLSPIYGGISYDRLELGGLQWPCADKQSDGTGVLYAEGLGVGAGAFAPVRYEDERQVPACARPWAQPVPFGDGDAGKEGERPQYSARQRLGPAESRGCVEAGS
jgi:predicted molibdopterin-dependent oxidoreductase YjgC